jgi:NitT/TauT family transport system substrate-binding protein
MKESRVIVRLLLVLSLLISMPVRFALAETPELRLGVQRGLTYLPWAVIEHEHLIEAAATDAGLTPPKVTYSIFSGGQAMNDGLLSNSIDVAATGIPSFLALWAKGKGRFAVRGLASYGTIRIALVSRNPSVKTLADFTDNDKIALPGVKTSTQAIFLAMAAEKLFGPEQRNRFDTISVTRGHPDAMAALMGNTEVNAHFSIPPYLQLELKRPDIHVVATSEEITGGTVSNGTIYLTTRFAEENPKTVAALYEGLRRSVALINSDPHRAAQIYLAVSGERTPIGDVEAMIKLPGTEWDVAPHGTLVMARFLKRAGMIAAEPADWKELYLPLVHNEPGS